MTIRKKILSLRELPSVRQLRAFMAVYETGSLSAAADLLALTQPAVTLLLRELEDKVGVRLFDRTTRTLKKTEAALEAYAYADRVLGELKDMTASLQDLSKGQRGRIQIAATSTLAQTLLPSVVKEFTGKWPNVRVSINDCSPNEFVEMVGSGRVTFGVGTLESPLTNVEETVFFKDTLVAVGVRSEVFSTSTKITWRQLAARPLVVVRPGYGVRRNIDTAAESAAVKLNIAYEVSMLSTAMAMASAGLGVAVVPSSVVLHSPYTNLVTRPLIQPVVARNVSVVYEKGKTISAAALTFIDLLKRSVNRRR